MKLYADLETFCERDLTRVGSYVYAEAAEITLFAYAIDDGPVECWDVTASSAMPWALEDALANPECQLIFHNGGQFDRLVLNARGYKTPVTRWYDTMVQAMTHSLPGSLDTLCDIFKLGVDQAKVKDGRKLVLQFCKPLPKNSKLRRATRLTHPAEWQQFIQYAKQDVEAMRVLHRKMPRWNYAYPTGPEDTSVGAREWRLWCLDQTNNDRGLHIDQQLVRSAIALIGDEKVRLAEEAQELTAGALERTTQRNKMLEYLLAEYGVALPDLTASTLQRRLDDPDLPQSLKLLLANRMQSTTVSTAKFNTLLRSLTADGALCGSTQFCGAGRTGRWSGRRFQPQNMARPDVDHKMIAFLIECVKAGEDISLMVNNIMKAVSNMLRGCIVARPGKKLVCADLSNIEGRVAAWLAGEEWKLQAFRDFDAGKGHDLYKLAYARAFGIRPEDVDKHMRQIGKVMELALGYEGGVGAFVTFALVYNMDLDQLADAVLPVVPQEILNDAAGMWTWAVKKRKTLGLERRVFIACDCLKRMWREAHPGISGYWKEVSQAIRTAVERPGVVRRCGKLSIIAERSWLKITLPSGRKLCYPSPQVSDDGQISYMGVDQYSRKWKRIKSYGGKFFENAVQAIARDTVAHHMPAIDAAGYQVLLTVHDEDVTEAPNDEHYNAKDLAAHMTAPLPWAMDLPLAAAGFEDERYHK